MIVGVDACRTPIYYYNTAEDDYIDMADYNFDRFNALTVPASSPGDPPAGGPGAGAISL